MNRVTAVAAGLALAWGTVTCAHEPLVVGALEKDAAVVSTGQVVRPAGETVTFGGRPVDMVASADGSTLFLKDNRGIVVVDAASWTVRQELPFGPDLGGSMHGIALSPDGRRLFATTAQDRMLEAQVAADGTLSWRRTLPLPGPAGKDASHATGIALDAAGRTAYVALSRNNTLAAVDLDSGRIVSQTPVGVAPYAVVLAPRGHLAYVTNWGGRPPAAGQRSADSSGTPVVVDDRGVGASGTVSIVDLQANKEIDQLDVGLHPTGLALSPDGHTLFVANANSDTVSVIDLDTAHVEATVYVRPTPDLPYGSAPNALALDASGARLYVANGGNNAVAVIDTASLEVEGYIRAGWYPGAVAVAGARLYVAGVKGFGSRNKDLEQSGWSVHWHHGTLSRVDIPSEARLAALTRQVLRDGRLRNVQKAWRVPAGDAAPRPVPRRTGQPSVFEHVVYVIKENRTYDQIFGDLPQANGDPALCVFPRSVTPNHHALAEGFILLDNFYCNGVNSADGHAWSTEGNVTDYLEKSFGGFTRSYAWGDDALSYSSSGFIWDGMLAKNRTFRNYGEMNYTEPVPADAPFKTVYDDFLSGARRVSFTHKIGIDKLRRYSCPDYPGWNMSIPDVLRADVFLKELARFEKDGAFPNFSIVFLPQDHGSGTRPGMPTPRAHVADNDLALGRVVGGLSRSRFWPRTCVFVVEDDPQDGFDHVDGHRSLCLVISPYTKRGVVDSHFYNQTSVLHTMARILGVPPMNQMDAMAPLMETCFADKPDLTPYTALPNTIPLDELNPPKSALTGDALRWAELSLAQNFQQMDKADEDTLNRIIWHSVKGVDAPYPAHYAGAHASGLQALGLALTPSDEDADE